MQESHRNCIEEEEDLAALNAAVEYDKLAQDDVLDGEKEEKDKTEEENNEVMDKMS